MSAILGSLGMMALGGIMGGGTSGTPPAPQAPAAPPASQAAQTPDQAALRGPSVSSAGSAASTLLTGPSGVEPSLLQLGRNTLLGG